MIFKNNDSKKGITAFFYENNLVNASKKKIIALIQEQSCFQWERVFPTMKPIYSDIKFSKNDKSNKSGIETLERPIPKPESRESNERATAKKIASLEESEKEWSTSAFNSSKYMLTTK